MSGRAPADDDAPSAASPPLHIVDPVDGTEWTIDGDFLASNWHCIWGAGCAGILDQPAEHLQQGCCSVGAELLDIDEAMLVAALGPTLDPEHFEHHGAAADGRGVLNPDRTNTRVVDGACIFLNRPGFAGGAGCALHLAAVAADEAPMDWKPEVCWQLPLRIDRNGDTATLRRWTRGDWGDDGASMAWCCTEGPTPAGVSPYSHPDRVIDSLGAEIEALVGPDVAVEIRRRLDDPTG